jgi:hypothetical protein
MTLRALANLHPGLLLALAETILIWIVANYGINSDPLKPRNDSETDSGGKEWTAFVVIRVALATILTLMVGHSDWHLAVIAALSGIGCAFLPIARRYWIPAIYAAEFEVAVLVVFLGLFTTLHIHWRIQAHPLSLPFSETRIAACLLVVAIVIFSLRGGTYIVRGILNKCGALPPLQHHRTHVDATEFNRGRWIGNLERILLLAIVAEPSYPAIAFLMAAKSLIRSKELEDRAWAEYFLLGTLASVMVALGCGFFIRKVIETFW